MVKNLPAMQETQVQSLGQEDPLEKGMAANSSILAWEIPWTKEPSGLQSMGSQESDVTEQLNTTRSGSLKRKTKFIKLLPDSSRKLTEGPNKIRNEREVTTDTTEVQKIRLLQTNMATKWTA